MKIKSLLLGSAAALVAVSGARAADAVVIPEPETVDYVRVCDMYGEGFFYIPGTETCINIGGYVRYQIDIEERFTDSTTSSFTTWDDGTLTVYEGGVDEWGWEKNTRGQLEIDVREETAYGTLRGFIAFQGNSSSGNVGLDAAYIELGGLHMGYSDNAFDGGINGETDVLGGAKTNRIAYTFASGSFDATISIDDDNGGGAGGLADFTPNVSANAGFDFGLGDARVYAAYDNQTEEFAVKGIVGIDVTDAGKFQLAAYYTSGLTYVLNGTKTFGVNEGFTGATPVAYATGVPTWAEWSVQGSYQHDFGALAATLSAGWFNNIGHMEDAFPGFDADMWNVGAMLDYDITENFAAKATVTHWMPTGDAGDLLDDKTTGFLRFQYSF